MATVAETTLRKILSNARIKPFQVSYYCERYDSEFNAKAHDVLVIYKQIEMQIEEDGKLIPLSILPSINMPYPFLGKILQSHYFF